MSGPTASGLVKTYAALLGLLALSVGASYAPLGHLHAPVSLAIAAAKAALVLLVFMEAAREGGATLVWMAAGVYWLAILLVFTLGDYLTRR